jgi:hypothetical protein
MSIRMKGTVDGHDRDPDCSWTERFACGPLAAPLGGQSPTQSSWSRRTGQAPFSPTGCMLLGPASRQCSGGHRRCPQSRLRTGLSALGASGRVPCRRRAPRGSRRSLIPIRQSPDGPQLRGSLERPLPFASILFASRNDPFMSFRDAERQAAVWRSTLYDPGEAGHVNIASGFGPWDDARTLADGLRRRVSIAPAASLPMRSWWNQPQTHAARAYDVGLGTA